MEIEFQKFKTFMVIYLPIRYVCINFVAPSPYSTLHINLQFEDLLKTIVGKMDFLAFTPREPKLGRQNERNFG